MTKVDVMIDEKLLAKARRQRNRARLLLALSLIVIYFLLVRVIQQEQQLDDLRHIMLQLTIEVDKLQR